MMTFPQILVILIILAPIVCVVLGRLRMDIAAMSMAVALGIAQFAGLGVLGPAQSPGDAAKAITGFGQPVVLTLIGLFIITRGLEKNGVTRWLATQILKRGGGSETRLIVLFVAVTAFLSLFMNNLAAAALILPGAMEVARLARVNPSKLLIPVAYGSLLGGAATYFTTANIIMSGLLTIAHPPQAPLHILDFTPTGGLIALSGILFFGLWGRRVLPDRALAGMQMLASPTGNELEDYYQLSERLWEAQVLPGSPLDGKNLAQSGIGETLGVTVAAVCDRNQIIFSPSQDTVIHTGNILLVIGREERVLQLAANNLQISKEVDGSHLSARGVLVFETLLAPHSHTEGKTLKELDFRRKYGFTAIALLRKERSFRTNVGDIPLAFGDSLLLIGNRTRIESLVADPDFITLTPNANDQPIQWGKAAFTSVVILAAILISILGFPVYLAMPAGALVIVLAGVLNMEEAYQSIEWQAVFLIAGMYAASLAMVQTGLATRLGQVMLTLVHPFGALGLAGGAYLLTALLTQVMGGQVTALVTGPIAISAALSMQTNPQAIAVATAIGCSASFLTPMAHPVNILMVAPANYTFGDFFKVGWRLTIISFVMLLAGMALFWGLR
jgi:di/tricarboxylate transporter